MSDRRHRPLLAPERRRRRRRPRPRRVRIAAALAGLGLIALLVVTIAFVVLEYVDQHAAMSPAEYAQNRLAPQKEK